MEYSADYENKMELAWAKADKLEKAGKISHEMAQKAKDLYHKKAEENRAKAGYSGGVDGSKIIIKDKIKVENAFLEIAKTNTTALIEKTKKIIMEDKKYIGGREVEEYQINKSSSDILNYNDVFNNAIDNIKSGKINDNSTKYILYLLGFFVLIGLFGK